MRHLLWPLGLCLLLVPAWPEPPLATGAYLQSVTADSAVVAMITARPKKLELVVVKPDGNAPAGADARPCRRHALQAKGLAAATRYDYEVREDGGAVLERGSFRTAPPAGTGRVKFCVIGDSGALPAWVWMQKAPLVRALDALGVLPASPRNSALGRAMAKEEPDLWLHVGDVVYPWGQSRHYREAFFRPFARLLRGSPCYPVLGNHDLGNSDPRYDDAGRPLLRSFVLPSSAVTGDSRCYSFAWGPVRFVALDLNGLDRGGEREVAEHPSVVHLRRELEGASEPWKIVYSHYPLWSASRQGEGGPDLQHVARLLEQAKVDLYLCGHDHVYQRLQSPAGLVEVGSGGGGKSLYDLREHPWRMAAASEYHYCVVEVDAASLRLRALTADGNELDQLVLTK